MSPKQKQKNLKSDSACRCSIMFHLSAQKLDESGAIPSSIPDFFHLEISASQSTSWVCREVYHNCVKLFIMMRPSRHFLMVKFPDISNGVLPSCRRSWAGRTLLGDEASFPRNRDVSPAQENVSRPTACWRYNLIKYTIIQYKI